jgi:hypothetical protein
MDTIMNYVNLHLKGENTNTQVNREVLNVAKHSLL